MKKTSIRIILTNGICFLCLIAAYVTFSKYSEIKKELQDISVTEIQSISSNDTKTVRELIETFQVPYASTTTNNVFREFTDPTHYLILLDNKTFAYITSNSHEVSQQIAFEFVSKLIHNNELEWTGGKIDLTYEYEFPFYFQKTNNENIIHESINNFYVVKSYNIDLSAVFEGRYARIYAEMFSEMFFPETHKTSNPTFFR